MEEPPTVFISYSHDSPSHRRWVLDLGTRLRQNGVNVVLDQWDLRLGEDVTKFMEDGVRTSDKVLAICTDSYVQKADEASGGVGYERLILTAALVQDVSTTKILPLVRQASQDKIVPTFLGTRYYIDFRNDDDNQEKYKELLHELHKVPIEPKPSLGRNPFASLPSGQVSPSSVDVKTSLPEIRKAVDSAVTAYQSAIEIARRGDVVGWRMLVKQIRPSTFDSIVQWRRSRLDPPQPPSTDQLTDVVDEAVGIVAPLMVVALAGVESGREQFSEQKSLLDDLLNIPSWERAGYAIWVEIPRTLGYVYQSLHGALSVATNQTNMAMSLARHRVFSSHDSEYREVWKTADLVGWSSSLGGDCSKSWSYLASAYGRWDWLQYIFENEFEYRSSLSAYYFALSIHSLASVIASDMAITSLKPSDIEVPLGFLVEGDEVCRRVISLLVRSPDATKALWERLDVTRAQITDCWDSWIHLCRIWAQNVYRRPYFLEQSPYERFFQALPVA